jgi:hypothetical protein
MSEEYSLGTEQIYRAEDIAARVYPAILLQVTETLTTEQSAALAVEVAVAICNEVREYRLKDGKAVRRSGENG